MEKELNNNLRNAFDYVFTWLSIRRSVMEKGYAKYGSSIGSCIKYKTVARVISGCLLL